MKASNQHLHIFKYYFKVLKRNIPSFSIYIIIFLILTVLLTRFNKSSNIQSFEQTKYAILYIDHDKTPVTEGLKSYLSKTANFTDKYTTKEEIQDALFAQNIRFIIEIPEGFTKDFLNGGDKKISKTSGQDMEDSTYINMALEKYLTTTQLIHKGLPDLSESQLAGKAASSLDNIGTVTVKNFSESTRDMKIPTILFSFLCYGLISIIFFGVTSIMLVFDRKTIQDRTMVSSIKPLKFNMQLFLGHIVYMLFAFICSMILSLVFLGVDIISCKQFGFFALNTLCLCFMLLCLSYLIGSFVRSRNAQQGIANVLGLGLSFISGVFVPLDILSPSVISVAHFVPTYWYVKATSDIGNLVNFNMTSLSPIFNAMLIEVGFAAAFLAIALVYQKQRAAKKII